MDKNKIITHPGKYIKDAISEMGISYEEFAEKVGIDKNTMFKIINGDRDISHNIAKKLSNFFETSMSVWINLQKAHNEKNK